ncbi:hypothetical protein FB451DRAFT_1237066 [Mycena latifolia]|nr:hypothetical protein FB451DRAFT_1237066 [Mycena latifolia]
MAALFPLAALTLLATASISGPASALFRVIRRVVQPAAAPRAEALPEDDTAGEPPLLAPFLRVFTTLFASLRFQPQPAATLLPVFRDQDDSTVHGAETVPNDSALHEGNTLVNAEASKVDADAEFITAQEESEADATAIRVAPPPYTRRPARNLPSPRRAYVDFTIGWDDVWPEHGGLPSPHVKYTYNSYLNAYTCSIWQEPVFRRPSPPPSDFTADSDIAIALELATQSPDDDLILALRSLSISDTAPPHSESPSYPASQPKSPPAGMSPFCPPPPPTPNPPQPATTWRLEWY